MSIRRNLSYAAVVLVVACCSNEEPTPASAGSPAVQGSSPNEGEASANPAASASAAPALPVTADEVLLTTLGELPGRNLLQTRGLYCHVLEYQGQGALESLLASGLSTIRQQASLAQANAVINVSISAGSYQNQATSRNAESFVICGDFAVVR